MAALSASTRSKAHENITLLNRQQNKLIRSKISGTKHIKYHHQFFDCGKFNETPKSIRKMKKLRTFQNERIRIPFVCSFFVFVALVVRSASLNMFYFIFFSFLVSTNLWEDEATLRANTKYLQLLSRSNRVSLGGPGKFKITSWASCDLFTITSFNLTAVCIRRTLSSSLCVCVWKEEKWMV